MKIIYRLSDNSYIKPSRLPSFTKMNCLNNALDQFAHSDFHMLVDITNLKQSTKEDLEQIKENEQFENLRNFTIEYISAGSSAQSFKIAVEKALTFSNDEVIFLIEDDYAFLNGSENAVLEGIKRAEYVTLYACPDKFYVPELGSNQYLNPHIDTKNGGELTHVIRTLHHYWMQTNSTTLTFATTVRVLKDDYDIWKSFCFATPEQQHPHDFEAFLALREKGQNLIQPLPSLSTHGEYGWLAYDTNWEKIYG